MAYNDVSNSRVMESDMAMCYNKEPLKGKRQAAEIPYYYKATRYNKDPNLGIVYRLDATERELDNFLVRKAEKIARTEAHVRIQSNPPRSAKPGTFSPTPQASRSSRRDASRKRGGSPRRRDSTPSKCRLRRTLNSSTEEVMMVLAPGGRVIRKPVKHDRNCPSRSTRASPCVSGGEGDRSRTSCSRVRTRICPCICHRGKSIRATCTESVRRLLLKDWAREGRGWNSLPFECDGKGRLLSDTDMEVHIHFPQEVTAKDYDQRFPFQNARSPVPSSLLPSARSRSSDYTSCYRETSFDTTASARLLPDSSYPSQEHLSPHANCPFGNSPPVSSKLTKQDLDEFINAPIPLMDGVRSLRTIFSRPCFPHESASSKDNAFLSNREASLPPMKRSHDEVMQMPCGRKCMSGAFLSFFSKEKTQIAANKSSMVTPLGSKPTQTIIPQRIAPEKPSSSRESRKRIESRSMRSTGGTPSERSRSFGTKSSQDSGSRERLPSPSTSTVPTRLSTASSYRTRDTIKHLSKDAHYMKKSKLSSEEPTQESGSHLQTQCLESRTMSATNQENGRQVQTNCLDSRFLAATGSSDSTYDPEYHPGTQSPVGRYKHRRDLCYPTCLQREEPCLNTESRELYPSRQGRSPYRTPIHSPPVTSPPLSHTPSLTTATYVQKKIMVSMQTRSTCFSEETCLISEGESHTSFNGPSCTSAAAQCSCRNLIRYPCGENVATSSPYIVRVETAKPKSERCPNLDSSPCSSQSPRSILTCSEAEGRGCSSSGSRVPKSYISCPSQLPPCQSSFSPCEDELPPSLTESPPCVNESPPCEDSYTQCPNSYPPCPNSFPPCPNSLPPCENSYPPCENSYPPCENSYPPCPNSSPPCENSHPPCPNSLSPCEITLPLCQNALPPCPNSLPPRENSFLPCPSSYSPCSNSLPPCENSLPPCPNSYPSCPTSLPPCENLHPPRPNSVAPCPNSYPQCQITLSPCQDSLPQTLSPCSSSCPNAFATRSLPCPNMVSPCPSVEIPCDDRLPPCTSYVQSHPPRSSGSPCSSQRTCPCSFSSIPLARGSPCASIPPTPCGSPTCTNYIPPCKSESRNVNVPACASVALSPCPSILPRCESVGISPIPSLQRPSEERSHKRITWDKASCEEVKRPSSIRTVIKCPSNRSTKCENFDDGSSNNCPGLSPSKTSIRTTGAPCPRRSNVCTPGIVPSVGSVRSMLSSAWSRCEEAVAERIRTICGPLTPCSSGESRRVCRPSQVTVSRSPSRRRCPASPHRLRVTDGVTSACSAPIRPDPGSSGECRQATLRSSCPCDVLATPAECYSSRSEPPCPVTSMYDRRCSGLPMEVQENLILFQWFPSMRLVVFSLILLSHLFALVIKLWYSQPKSGSRFLFC